MEKIFKKFISLTLILSFVISPYLVGLNVTYAQSYGASGSYQYGSSFKASAGVSGYLSGLAPAITKLPLCRDKLAGAVKKLFTKTRSYGLTYDNVVGGTSILGGNQKKESGIGAGGSTGSGVGLSLKNTGSTFSLSGKANSGININDSVSTYDPNANKKLDTVIDRLKKVEATTSATEENQTCIRNIGQLLVKELLKQLTVSTVEWINTGAEGGPLFVRDPQRFWGDIAKNEILQFGFEISDETKYPFGKRFMQQRVRAIQNGFAKNAEYSLNDLIQKTTPEFTDEEFLADFSKGGWAAWTFLTQVPANNPIGFQLLANNELDKRLEGTEISVGLEMRATLAQTGGFLNDVRCADPRNLSREAHNEAIRAAIKDPVNGGIAGTCKRWEAVTPGTLIAEAATQTMHSTKDSLLQVDDLNSAIAAVLDAFLAKFTSSIAVDGYAGFSDGAGYEADDGGLDIFGGKSQTENDFTDYQRNSEWIENNPDFNIRTDLTQALIDEQRTYKEKLEEQNNVLYDLNKVIFQLDYCIPGPHPGWEQDSWEVLDAVEKTIPSKTAADFDNISGDQIANIAKSVGYAAGPVIAAVILGAKLGAAIGTATPLGPLGTALGALIGILIGVIIDWINKPDDGEKLELYYSYIFRGFTGVKIDAGAGGKKGPGITSKQDVTNAFDTMLERYIQMIRKYYIPEMLPSVAPEAAREFAKIEGYFEIIIDNKDKILLTEGVSKRLGELKSKIDALNLEYGVTKQNPVPTNEAEYEEKLKPFISEFALLSKNLVTGDEVAEADSLMKEAREEIKYVYEDLLTGEYGCEKDIELGRQADLHKIFEKKDLGSANRKAFWTLLSSRRGEYPFEVLYDYNILKEGEAIPVPEDLIKEYNLKRPNNKMPNYPGWDIGGGPGFLSNVIYDTSSDPECKFEMTKVDYWLDCLKVSDLFNNVDSQVIPVTQNLPNYPDKKGQWVYEGFSFEKTIGVY